MAFNRVIELEIISNNSIITKISNLNIEFNIERTNIFSTNKANFTIYNASENTRNQLFQKGNNLIFRAGYEDENNKANIFFGTIFEGHSIKENTEWKSYITAQDIFSNKKSIDFQTLSYSYIKDTLVSQVINDIAGYLSVPVTGIENVTSQLKNNFVYCGKVMNYLKEIKKIIEPDNLELYFDSGQMIIYRKGNQISKFGVVNLTSNHIIGGIENILDEVKQDKKHRIKLTTLLNPKIQPNSIISLNTDTTKGIYIVEKVVFKGDNMSGDFFAEVEAIS